MLKIGLKNGLKKWFNGFNLDWNMDQKMNKRIFERKFVFGLDYELKLDLKRIDIELVLERFDKWVKKYGLMVEMWFKMQSWKWFRHWV